MKPTEAVTLCRYVKAACPQQTIDEYTPQAWTDLLGDLRLTDAMEAARNLGQRQHFIDPADLRTEVRRIRNRRIDEHPPIDPPVPMTPYELNSWLKTTRQRIADGETIEQAELPARDVRELLTSNPQTSRTGEPA